MRCLSKEICLIYFYKAIQKTNMKGDFDVKNQLFGVIFCRCMNIKENFRDPKKKRKQNKLCFNRYVIDL